MRSAFEPGLNLEHVSLHELAELVESGASTREALLALFRHLARLCPHCREELAPLLARLEGRPEASRSEEEFLAALLKAAFESEQEKGDEDWHTLAEEHLALTAEERETLWHCDRRTHSLALGFALLEVAESLLGRDAAASRRASQLVLALVERRASDGRGEGRDEVGLSALAADLAAGAFAVQAQLALLGKDTEAATGPLVAAEALAAQGSGDPDIAATVLLARALLLWVRGEATESARLHRRAAALWEAAGEAMKAAITHARRATMLDSVGEAEAARQARELAARLCRQAGEEVPEGWLVASGTAGAERVQ